MFATTEETVYLDGCHLNERGYTLYARQVEAWIAERLGRPAAR